MASARYLDVEVCSSDTAGILSHENRRCLVPRFPSLSIEVQKFNDWNGAVHVDFSSWI
jgi:hypothetical protein